MVSRSQNCSSFFSQRGRVWATYQSSWLTPLACWPACQSQVRVFGARASVSPTITLAIRRCRAGGQRSQPNRDVPKNRMYLSSHRGLPERTLWCIDHADHPLALVDQLSKAKCLFLLVKNKSSVYRLERGCQRCFFWCRGIHDARPIRKPIFPSDNTPACHRRRKPCHISKKRHCQDCRRH